MKVLLAVTVCAVLISYFSNPEKTRNALGLALKKCKRIGVPIAWTIVLSATVVELMNSTKMWQTVFGGDPFWATLGAATAGSVAIMPGGVAFPLGAILLKQGVSHMVVAGFTVALMTVGVVTFPFERAYLGTRVAIIRNAIGFGIALVVAIAIGMAFGELS